MIIKRILTLVLDFAFAFIPSIVVYFASIKSFPSLDFSIMFSIIFLIGIIFEVLYSKGLTAGMLLTKIHPIDLGGNKASSIKLVIYYAAISVCLVPALNHLSSLILFLIVIIPLPIFKECVSIIDLLFKLRWALKGDETIINPE